MFRAEPRIPRSLPLKRAYGALSRRRLVLALLAGLTPAGASLGEPRTFWDGSRDRAFHGRVLATTGGQAIETRLLPRPAVAAQRTCAARAGKTAQLRPFLLDSTLRPGDGVMTAHGLRVFRGGAYPHKAGDFLSLAEARNLPMALRRAFAAIDRRARPCE